MLILLHPNDLTSCCTLEEPISVTSADSKSNLKAVATMQIPITWENKTETAFTLLLVSGLVWPMLFGENHLHVTQALVDHYGPSPFGTQVCSFVSSALSTIHLKASQVS